jgi:gluconate 2-dehydrogenase alpha chain
MTTKLRSADIVIVGLGWTGGILAKELADTGLSIVVLERGAPRDTNPDFMYPTVHDELRYAQRHELMQNVSRETFDLPQYRKRDRPPDASARLVPAG